MYKRVDRTAVRIFGEDRLTWLQGQATNDMRELSEANSVSFCLCTPIGQLTAICTAWDMSDHILVIADEKSTQELIHRLNTMVIMEEVTFDHPQTSLYATSSQNLTNSGLLTKELGYDSWFILDDPNDTEIEPEDMRNLALLEAGTPRFSVDTNEKTLPPELGAHFEASHISYAKGCYVGQEVLMRLHSRGHTNWTWMGLFTEALVMRGDKLSHSEKPDAGYVTSAGVSDKFGPIAAAYVRREVALEGESVLVGATNAKLTHMPFLRLS